MIELQGSGADVGFPKLRGPNRKSILFSPLIYGYSMGLSLVVRHDLVIKIEAVQRIVGNSCLVLDVYDGHLPVALL